MILQEYIIECVKRILLEGRLEDAQAKYPEVPAQYWHVFIENDPSGNLKYLDWMVKNSGFVITDAEYNLDFLFKAVELFHKNKHKYPKKDIYAYNVEELYLTGKEVEKKVSERQKRKDIKKNTTKLYDNEEWHILMPTSHGASCFYGAGTKWCIAERNSRHWDNYTNEQQIEFVFALNKTKSQKDPMYKIAFAVYPNGKCEVFNAKDDQIYQGPFHKAVFKILPNDIASNLWNKFSDAKKKKISKSFSSIIKFLKTTDDVDALEDLERDEINLLIKSIAIIDLTLEDYLILEKHDFFERFGNIEDLQRNHNISEEALVRMHKDGNINILGHPAASQELKEKLYMETIKSGGKINNKINQIYAADIFNNASPEFVDIMADNFRFIGKDGEEKLGVPIFKNKGSSFSLDERGYKNLARLFVNAPVDEMLFVYYELAMPSNSVDIELVENRNKLEPEKRAWIEEEMLPLYEKYEKFAKFMEENQNTMKNLFKYGYKKYERYKQAKIESGFINKKLGEDIMDAIQYLSKHGIYTS